ncbi:efflux RND transporter periplasmic adaptor subunit [Thiohalorhabdus denitrificans]|uniref:RND family efflux transporter, MFP subunit n=2 Tax=Thiohalorhabdus denitrificans TaxID=381306 RepID=A0A1G5G6N9_9GAMM|nr:efflux RND transporter periplasmic adaptor subunit [Thiohalorhabdus denitrificans]SCY47202.1 RND family efflux transporter, MFP subunit [Thiohalorhabdus denitrificans]
MAPPAHRTSTAACGPLRGATPWAWLAALLVLLPHPGTAQDAPPVEIQPAETAPIVEEVRVTGTVTSPRVAQVSTSVGGLVEEMHVDSGHWVEAGEPLLELDRELEALQLRQEQAAVKEAREELADARRRLSEAERLARDQNLPESELRAREAEVRVATATVERLQARADHQAERLERHRVEAPFTGVVARKRTAAGEWVEPGTPVVELVALEELRLDFQAPQAHYPRIDEQTPVRVHLETAPDNPLKGEVAATIPVSDPEARTFTVRVHVDRDAAPITPGMAASATLLLETDRTGVVVLRDALLRHPDGRETVWVAREEDGKLTVRERRVETGLTFDGQVEIRSGLEDGDRVVTRGNESLQEGQEVRPVDDG